MSAFLENSLSECAILRERAKNPGVAAQTLQASVSMLNGKVHDSTIRKRLGKFGLFGRVARRKTKQGNTKCKTGLQNSI